MRSSIFFVIALLAMTLTGSSVMSQTIQIQDMDSMSNLTLTINSTSSNMTLPSNMTSSTINITVGEETQELNLYPSISTLIDYVSIAASLNDTQVWIIPSQVYQDNELLTSLTTAISTFAGSLKQLNITTRAESVPGAMSLALAYLTLSEALYADNSTNSSMMNNGDASSGAFGLTGTTASTGATVVTDTTTSSVVTDTTTSAVVSDTTTSAVVTDTTTTTVVTDTTTTTGTSTDISTISTPTVTVDGNQGATGASSRRLLTLKKLVK